MNTGIQDAYNLAWKMALVLHGAAAPGLLDTYEAERRPVGADVVARTRTQSEQFGRKQTAQEERLTETQILVNYRTSRLSRESLSEPESLPVHAGDRAPDCSGLLRANVRYPYRLFDITRGVFSCDPSLDSEIRGTPISVRKQQVYIQNEPGKFMKNSR